MKNSLKVLLTLVLFISSSSIYAQDFFQSIRNGDYEKVEQFIQDEPKLADSLVQWNITPLIYASYLGQDSIVELLLNNGADMYKVCPDDDIAPIHCAAMQNFPSIINLFISKGIDVNIKDTANKTAMVYAIENNSAEIIDLLLENNAVLPDGEVLVNSCLQSAVLNNIGDVANKLLENGASLSGVDKYGRSLMHNAIIGDNAKWIDLLIEKPEILNSVDSFIRTPLHYAAELNQLENAKALVKHHAEVNAVDNTNRTARNVASDLGNNEMDDFLETKGGNLLEPTTIKIHGDGKHSEIEVTYIANMGVMISSASKKVLIDAVFDESYNIYPITPKNVVNKLNSLEAPFDSIDLIMVTHSDGDHFSAPMIADYMAKNQSVKVVCNRNTASAIKDTIGAIDTNRIVGILPDLFNSVDTLVNNMEIKVLRLRHDGQDDSNDNLGFMIEMDGINIFHSGDSDGFVKHGMAVNGVQEYDSIGIEEMGIDLALLGRGFVWNSSSPGLEILEKYMKPKYIIVGHFSDYNKQGEWQRVDNTLRKHKDDLPEMTLFKWQMQKVIIQKVN